MVVLPTEDGQADAKAHQARLVLCGFDDPSLDGKTATRVPRQYAGARMKQEFGADFKSRREHCKEWIHNNIFMGQGDPLLDGGSDGDESGDDEASGLRFVVGQTVICKMGQAWRPGTIRRLYYREPSWAPGEVAPYQIELMDEPGHLIYAPDDADDVIREWDEGDPVPAGR